MTSNLSGKVALVTGGSSGIGEASALALVAAGASVMVCARRAGKLAALVDRMNGRGAASSGDVSVEGRVCYG